MGDAEEARAYQREVSEALAGQLSNSEEDEVEDELEGLEREVNGVRIGKLPEVPGGEVLPDAPTEELGREQKRKDRARERKAALEAA